VKTPKRWFRRLLRSARTQRLLCWAAQFYIRLVYLTNRWRVEGGEIPERLRHRDGGLIIAFWHGRLMMVPLATPRLAPVHMLISAHRDGRIIAGAVSYFDIGYIPGSTRRGGAGALRAMLKHLADGAWVGITPDGPRGPAMRVGGGIVDLARLARVPVVPLVFATSRRRILNTWDCFYLALPFGRGLYLWGEPIEIGAELDGEGSERARLLIEERLNELAERADRRVGGAAAARPGAERRTAEGG